MPFNGMPAIYQARHTLIIQFTASLGPVITVHNIALAYTKPSLQTNFPNRHVFVYALSKPCALQTKPNQTTMVIWWFSEPAHIHLFLVVFLPFPPGRWLAVLSSVAEPEPVERQLFAGAGAEDY
jgi:hypothetical protein